MTGAQTALVVAAGVLAALLGVGGAVVGVVVARRARRDVGRGVDAAAAAAAGWTWHGDGRPALDAAGVHGIGAPGARGVMTTRVGGRDVVAAATTGRGWQVQRRRVNVSSSISGLTYTLCAVRLPGALPTVNLLAEGRGGGVASALGLPDVDTESGAFNRARRVVADDDRTAHGLLAPHVVEAVASGPDDATLQTVGDLLVSYRRGAPELAEVTARTAWLVRVADAVPAFLYDPR
jgi:hypothetical protein